MAGERDNDLQLPPLLKKHKLTEVLLTTVNEHLKRQKLMVSKGTMVNATILHATVPSKTRRKPAILT